MKLLGHEVIENDEELVSKTAKKKMMTALQEIGETLVKLSATRLDDVPLDENLRTAVLQAKKMENWQCVAPAIAVYRQTDALS